MDLFPNKNFLRTLFELQLIDRIKPLYFYYYYYPVFVIITNCHAHRILLKLQTTIARLHQLLYFQVHSYFSFSINLFFFLKKLSYLYLSFRLFKNFYIIWCIIHLYLFDTYRNKLYWTLLYCSLVHNFNTYVDGHTKSKYQKLKLIIIFLYLLPVLAIIRCQIILQREAYSFPEPPSWVPMPMSYVVSIYIFTITIYEHTYIVQ